jgi:small GTP-binding protein
MLRRILSDSEDALLGRERELLVQLAGDLARLDASAEDQARLDASLQQLDELFLLVVIGEFNAGKSAFINALLGQALLEEGVTPTTSRIQRLRYGAEVTRRPESAGLDTVTAPLPLLSELQIVDTPGTNAIHREHEALTREFVPRCDLVLFVTSADRPFTESERTFLQAVRAWGKKIVVVINKIDILETEGERQRVIEFVRDAAQELLATSPQVLPVSSRRALRAKLAGQEAPADSGFPALEAFLASNLDAEERVRLKLLNPLGIGQALTDRYLELADSRLALLAEDVVALSDVDAQLVSYREDLQRDFRYRLSDVDNLLHELEARGARFFDDTMRIGRLFDLMNRARLEAEFEHRVVAEAPREIEQRVGAVIDWMVASELKQWQAVTEHVERRRQAHADRIVGRVGGGFDYDRSRLLETVGRAARTAVDSYDTAQEASRMADSVQQAVAAAAIFEAGAIGLGAIVTMVATTTFADVTGLLAAGTVAVLGLFVIPARRKAAKRELAAKISEMRERLTAAITGQFERELEGSEGRIREAIAPYTRFVRGETERLAAARQQLLLHRDSLAELRRQIG